MNPIEQGQSALPQSHSPSLGAALVPHLLGQVVTGGVLLILAWVFNFWVPYAFMLLFLLIVAGCGDIIARVFEMRLWTELRIVNPELREGYLVRAAQSPARYVMMLLIWPLMVLIFALMSLSPAPTWLPGAKLLFWPLTLVVLTGTYLLAWWLTRGVTRQRLRTMMIADGIPICIACGYDLRGHGESPRCPECGESVAASGGGGL